MCIRDSPNVVLFSYLRGPFVYCPFLLDRFTVRTPFSYDGFPAELRLFGQEPDQHFAFAPVGEGEIGDKDDGLGYALASGRAVQRAGSRAAPALGRDDGSFKREMCIRDRC